ncbi:hypothetical protein, partial [Klebsiella pneumoniae]|uniref:hypothetical protein n=1 Tax=Klebsiella pneumoniae TaxID=573 RepID=UPI001EE3E726
MAEIQTKKPRTGEAPKKIKKELTHECISTLEPFGNLVFPDKFSVKLLLYTFLNPPQSKIY